LRSAGRTCFVESPLTLEQLTLSFWVSKDEEFVGLKVRAAEREFDLGDRTHHYLLLTLARRRLADLAEGLPAAACGWLHVDELAHDESMVGQRLNLNVLRIRRHFSSRGIVDAWDVVERRLSTRQLRIGTDRVSIAAI
jgi:hypothetical protein